MQIDHLGVQLALFPGSCGNKAIQPSRDHAALWQLVIIVWYVVVVKFLQVMLFVKFSPFHASKYSKMYIILFRLPITLYIVSYNTHNACTIVCLHALEMWTLSQCCNNTLVPVVKSPFCELYTMVGNFRKVFIFVFFASQEPFARKLKPRKFCCPRVKRTNRVSIPGLLLYSSLQKRVSECALDGYHWSNQKC